LAHMSKSHEDWQVKQANTALRLYDYFLSHEIKANAGGGPAAEGDWQVLEEKMREMLRPGQRSQSTEKTDLTRRRSFRALVPEKEPSCLEGGNFRIFSVGLIDKNSLI